MKEMKRLPAILGIALMLTALFASCENPADGTEEPGTSKEITAFTINGTAAETIDADSLTVVVTLPHYPLPDLTSLAPTIVHNGASIDPESDAAQDFYRNGFTPVIYTVTAEDGSTAEWNVTVKLAPLAPDSDIADYLAGVPSGWGVEDRPVPLTLAVDLEAGWAPLLSAIDGAEKYVALDLSACGMGESTEFDRGSANTGEKYVVSLVLPDAAKSIKGGNATSFFSPPFRFFTKLKSLSAKNAESVGIYAFYNTALTSVNLPAVTILSDYAFGNCAALTSVSFPTVTSLGVNAFYGCTALTSVSFPAVTSLNGFGNCTALTSVSFPAATSIRGFGNCTALTTLTEASFPVATSIEDVAFAVCTALTSVNLPNVTNIGIQTFQSCTALTSVNFPAATSIGDSAFGYCPALSTADLPAVTSIGRAAFRETGDTALSINLPATAPAIATNDKVNAYSSFIKNVTVNVPSGAKGYDKSWEADFKTTFGVSNGNHIVTINLTVNEQASGE
jgi:hypothetical protein